MNDNFIMSPKVDFAFKEIMRDETVRKGFLSAVLGIKDTKIKSTVLFNTNLPRIHGDEKQGILDIRLTMNDNTEIDIEMQVCSMKTWAERSVFYVSKDDCRADQHQQDVFKHEEMHKYQYFKF